jgi:hypothetical protein
MKTENNETAETAEKPKTLPPTKTTRFLAVKLTQEDRLKFGQDLADASEMKAQLERQAAEISKRFKAQIAEQDSRMGSLANVIRCGYEYKDVACLVHLDTPKPGRKSLVRTDTGEVAEELDMTGDDTQAVMDFAKDTEE